MTVGTLCLALDPDMSMSTCCSTCLRISGRAQIPVGRQRCHSVGRATSQGIIQALLVDIAKVAPEGALAALLAEVLAEPSNWDTTLVGLQALLVILFEGPKQSSSRAGVNPEVGCRLPASRQVFVNVLSWESL